MYTPEASGFLVGKRALEERAQCWECAWHGKLFSGAQGGSGGMLDCAVRGGTRCEPYCQSLPPSPSRDPGKASAAGVFLLGVWVGAHFPCDWVAVFCNMMATFSVSVPEEEPTYSRFQGKPAGQGNLTQGRAFSRKKKLG